MCNQNALDSGKDWPQQKAPVPCVDLGVTDFDDVTGMDYSLITDPGHAGHAWIL